MTLNVNAARNEYTSGASQTIFNYTFKIYAATDLDVYVTPAGQACSSSDLTTSYTVAGIGLEAGGSITLTTPANSGDLVTIVSSIPTNRTIDYQNNGDFRPDTVNDDFDRAVSLVKQSEDLSNRALLFPACEQGVSSLSLPPPVDSAFLRWKSDLSGMENFTFSSSGITAEVSVTTYAALRALVSSAYTDGQVIFITNNGIAGEFIVRTGTVTDNGGTLIVFTDNSNRYAERSYQGPVNVEWFGVTIYSTEAAARAGTDDTTKVQSWLDLQGDLEANFDGFILVDVDSGTTVSPFTIQMALNVKDSTRIILGPNTNFVLYKNAIDVHALFGVFERTNVHIEGGTLIGDRDTHEAGTGEGGMGVFIAGECEDVRIRDVFAKDFWGDGFYTTAQDAYVDAPRNLYWEGLRTDNCRRNGASVTFCDGMWITDCSFSNSDGVAPESGLDVEPNAGNSRVRRLFINNLEANNNSGVGLLLFCPDSATVEMEEIVVSNVTANSNGQHGCRVSRFGDLIIDGLIVKDNTQKGLRFDYESGSSRSVSRVAINNVISENNGQRGIEFDGTGSPLMDFSGSNWVVMGNGTSGSYEGVWIDNVDESQFHNIQTKDNTGRCLVLQDCEDTEIIGFKSKNEQGFRFQDSDRCLLAEFRIIDSHVDAINVTSSSLDCEIRNGTIINPNTTATANTDAIYVQTTSTGGIVKNVTVKNGTGNSRDLIRIESGCNNWQVSNNILSDTGTGVALTDSATGTVKFLNRDLSILYTAINASADRSYDANATTVGELADVLATLIVDLNLDA